MNRKKFIRNCGMVCAGFVGALPLLQGCSASKVNAGNIVGDEMIVPLKYFETRNENEVYHKKYIIVENSMLKYPICIYRLSETEYSALWMRCTHQGTELQVFGSRLQCPAHGSEFSHDGQVQAGPASDALRSFPVTILNDHLRLSLKAV